MLYDITRTVTSTLAVWPGDTPYTVNHMAHKGPNVPINLTTLTLSAHTGSHADAYYHFADDGVHPSQMPLEAYIGPARVVTVSKRHGPLTPADFAHVDLNGVERLLIHSHISDQADDQWSVEFPYLSAELIEWLAGMGVRLIGLDSPSVDDYYSEDLPSHHALRRHNIVNLETLQLRGVPDGDYELIALPLKLDEACGSPVRAVLRTR
jgi:arylformamidase